MTRCRRLTAVPTLPRATDCPQVDTYLRKLTRLVDGDLVKAVEISTERHVKVSRRSACCPGMLPFRYSDGLRLHGCSAKIVVSHLSCCCCGLSMYVWASFLNCPVQSKELAELMAGGDSDDTEPKPDSSSKAAAGGKPGQAGAGGKGHAARRNITQHTLEAMQVRLRVDMVSCVCTGSVGACASRAAAKPACRAHNRGRDVTSCCAYGAAPSCTAPVRWGWGRRGERRQEWMRVLLCRAACVCARHTSLLIAVSSLHPLCGAS